MPSIDFDLLRHALTVAKETGLNEVEIEIGDTSFSAVIGTQGPKPKSPVSSSSVSGGAGGKTPVTSPLVPIKSLSVGIFHNQPNLTVGTSVQKGDKVGAIVALGISNDVVASASGVVAEVLVEDGGVVEYGQPIAKVDTSSDGGANA